MEQGSDSHMDKIKARLKSNIDRVLSNIAEAAMRVGRDPKSITLVIVTKYVDLDIIRLLLELGYYDLGESRVQQLVQRSEALREDAHLLCMIPDGDVMGPRWHMVGHLQRNKVKQLLPYVYLIHSVDNLRLAEEINNRAKKLNKIQDVLVQVNCSNEPQKHGIAIPAVVHFVEQLLTLPNIRVRGLMTMAARVERPEDARPTFEMLYELFLETKLELRLGKGFEHLSMGMSGDYTEAVKCGATIVRIGSAIFEGIPIVEG